VWYIYRYHPLSTFFVRVTGLSIKLRNLIWLKLWYIQLGGGYLFGLPIGFVADSVGATLGSGAAFLLGRTVSHSNSYWFADTTIRLMKWHA
jgi:hypothetical protein